MAKHDDTVVVESSVSFNFATDIEYEVYHIKGRTFLSRELVSQFQSEEKLIERLKEEDEELHDRFKKYLETGERQGFSQNATDEGDS